MERSTIMSNAYGGNAVQSLLRPSILQAPQTHNPKLFLRSPSSQPNPREAWKAFVPGTRSKSQSKISRVEIICHGNVVPRGIFKFPDFSRSSTNSSGVRVAGTRKGGVANQLATAERTENLQFPELIQSNQVNLDIQREIDRLPVRQVDVEHDGSLQRAEAGVSLSRAPGPWQVERSEQFENCSANDKVERISKDLNLGEDSGLDDGVAPIIQKKRRGGVFNILARDMEVIQEGMSWIEQVVLPHTREADAGAPLKNSPVGHEVGLGVEGTVTVHEQHRSRTGIFNILARDLEVIQEGMSLVEQVITKEVKAGRFRRNMAGVEEGYYLDKDQTIQRETSSNFLKTGVTFLNKGKDGLVNVGESLFNWAKIAGKKTGVDKIIVEDVKFVQESICWLKEEATEILRMKGLEDSSAVWEPLPPWPQPVYPGLSGKDLFAADIEALKSYGNYFSGFLSTWQVPLQLSYDPEAVANYFNRRPHIILFRFLEVSAAFSGVSLQLLVNKANLGKDKTGFSRENEDGQSTPKIAEALKQTLVRLGPTFIKVAQSLSSRPDLIGTHTAKVLSELQDRLPPFPTEDAMVLIEEELGVPADQVFSYLSENPVAAASFGQVYKGCTFEGEEVAVKVQRPDLLFDVTRDIYILRLGLGLVRKLAKMNSDISVLADELGHGLIGELDYTLEAANAKEFETLHKHLSFVKVPRTLPHLTTKRVLTMEWIHGDRPMDLQTIAKGTDLSGGFISMNQRYKSKLHLDDLVRKGVESSLVQLLDTGLLHADPHPGNLLYTKEGILTYLDFGLLARVNKKHQAGMLAVIAHLVNGEWQCLANDFADLDLLKPSTDRFALRLALERAFGEGPDPVVQNGVPDIQFGQLTGKLWKIALKFRFRLPAYYTLVLRSLASLEGIAVSVDPDYKVFAAAYPYVIRRLLNDNSRQSRQVLQSLVLTRTGDFRWDRIASIMASSRKSFSESSHQGTGDRVDSFSKELPHRKDLAFQLLSFTLAKEGRSVRRVLLEANTSSLAVAFVSAPGRSLRSKVTYQLAETFYQCALSFTKVEYRGNSRGSGLPTGRTVDPVTSTTEVTVSGRPQSEILPDSVEMSQLSSDIFKNQRLWFLLKVLASRLRASPILMVRVGWEFMTMVSFAAALALHRYAITLTEQLFCPDSKKMPKLAGTVGEHYNNAQLQAPLSFTSVC